MEEAPSGATLTPRYAAYVFQVGALDFADTTLYRTLERVLYALHHL